MTAELDYLNEENGRLRREIATWKAETQALIKRAEDAERKMVDGVTIKQYIDLDNEVDQLRAELARLKAQEPFGYVDTHPFGQDYGIEIRRHYWKGSRPVYLAPGAAPTDLQAKLAAMESLLGAALGALRYHTEQTRPIQRTYETITMIEASVASLASGAAQKEPIQDVAMHVLISIGGIDYDTAKSLVENAYGAAQKENT